VFQLATPGAATLRVSACGAPAAAFAAAAPDPPLALTASLQLVSEACPQWTGGDEGDVPGSVAIAAVHGACGAAQPDAGARGAWAFEASGLSAGLYALRLMHSDSGPATPYVDATAAAAAADILWPAVSLAYAVSCDCGRFGAGGECAADVQHLRDDFPGGEVAHETHLARGAEHAAHRTSRLGADAGGEATLVFHQHGLDHLPVGEA
jgi:hypothetical protein